MVQLYLLSLSLSIVFLTPGDGVTVAGGCGPASDGRTFGREFSVAEWLLPSVWLSFSLVGELDSLYGDRLMSGLMVQIAATAINPIAPASTTWRTA